mmetsp:Transcript_10109/g.12267  ORF Transcript_10109/g.12267 Transcript_10109/m.12267 type:complete len:86 (-) Transcript_10109:247-504(-)|eukprot:CAMPEP_0114393622 /NCGR_PEP_ID=MMETSP0102-20121206/11639_1 /TAXON_ID=38822 ORGANISM="Pteridomonas danica, Strain PT" /NCGR_SAMPLE_ID=MMETSP0102 /ASSEMBLY_ACC=CAM_ASM_000212 /LENGTH=85 /DNA_ID=CAMNT_0001553299 /DNA_START=12 /DNA_END=269 /DNA_ORIENTATION=-
MATPGGAGAPYSNLGLKRWEEGRKKWLEVEESGVEKTKRAVNVNIDLIIDRIFSPESDGTLPHAVPLPQLIDLMTDLWEADGLFD